MLAGSTGELESTCRVPPDSHYDEMPGQGSFFRETIKSALEMERRNHCRESCPFLTSNDLHVPFAEAIRIPSSCLGQCIGSFTLAFMSKFQENGLVCGSEGINVLIHISRSIGRCWMPRRPH